MLATFSTDGLQRTPNIMWLDGTEYDIESPIYSGETASQIAGGIGMIYRYRIHNHAKKLFYKRQTLRWFVERKPAPP